METIGDSWIQSQRDYWTLMRPMGTHETQRDYSYL